MSKHELVIIKRKVYVATILNYGQPSVKDRPVLVLLTSDTKVLALQFTSSEKFNNPKPLPSWVVTTLITETNSIIKGVSFGTSHWIPKTSLKNTFVAQRKDFEFSVEACAKFLSHLKQVRKKQIAQKENKIRKHINIAVKANNQTTIKTQIDLIATEMKWIAVHSIEDTEYQKIKNLKGFAHTIVMNKKKELYDKLKKSY